MRAENPGQNSATFHPPWLVALPIELLSEDLCESQPHKGHLNSKLNSKTAPVLLSPDPSLIFALALSPLPFLSSCHRTTTT